MSKNYFKYALFFFIFFVSCKRYTITTQHYNNINIQHQEFDSVIYQSYKPYKDSLDKLMFLPIATLEETVNKGQPSSSLGNLIADILFETTSKKTNTTLDFAIMNYGGIRVTSLSKGTIKILDAYTIMPFDNYIGVIYLKGADVQQFCDSIAQKGGWPISQQLSFEIKNNRAINISINQKSLDLQKNYKVAIIDYIANGGDSMTFLKDKKFDHSGILFRDAIIDYFKSSTSPIIPSRQNRIMYAQ